MLFLADGALDLNNIRLVHGHVGGKNKIILDLSASSPFALPYFPMIPCLRHFGDPLIHT